MVCLPGLCCKDYWERLILDSPLNWCQAQLNLLKENALSRSTRPSS